MPDLNLSMAVGDYDRTRPIFDGWVKIDGVNPIVMLQSPEEIFFNAFRHKTCDISELSLSSYCVSLTRDDPPYIAIPVYLSRAFRHTSIYIRSDRGISSPDDLKGKRIGVAEYQLSANVWVRAILSEYGVEPKDIIWVRGGMDTPARPEKLKITLPDSVQMEQAPASKSLNQLLIEGEIDGFIGPRWPRCFSDPDSKVVRLFEDTQAVAEDWYKKTGIFPIMHVVGVRRSLAEEHPWLPGALFKAFNQAKTMATDALADTSATKVTMAFVEDTLGRAQKLSAELWTYGVPENKHVLNYFLDHHHAQGLSPRRVQLDEMFHPATVESFSL